VLGEGGRPEINVTVKGNTLGLSDPTGSLALVADLDLALDTRPTAERPGLTGKVGVQQGIVDVGFITQLTGSETNAEVEKPRGGGGIPLNVDVSIPGGLRVIGEDITLDENLNVELRGDLIVRMDPPGPLYLLGSLETVTGRDVVYAYNRRWSIDRGTFTFGTIEEINPNLDVELNAQIDEDTQVTLTLGGTMREPTTLWSSDNPNLQSQGDILLLVLPFNPTLGVQTAMATQWATRYVESAVSRQAGQWLGVDTFEIQGLLAGSSGQNTQISVGKFVGSQYYVRTSLDVGGTGTASQFGLGDVGVEYRLNRNFRLSASRDFRLRIYLLELKWRIDY
jgi:autotransporter translocation and assembly factor TamB